MDQRAKAVQLGSFAAAQQPGGLCRLDIYKGRIVPFVPFTKLEGEAIKGTHNNPK
jgi:hypothetical protein